MAKEAQYSQIITHIFSAHYRGGDTEVVFDREEIVDAAQKLGLARPKNVGDVVYSFRFRKAFPEAIKKTAPEGLEWILRKAGARTSVAGMGGVETDEMYVGVNRLGVHYVLPVQAKGGRDRLSVVQIEQDIALCAEKFPSLVCRPIAAQFMRDDVIALFEFEVTDEQVTLRDEKHYRLVAPDQLSAEELEQYRRSNLD